MPSHHPYEDNVFLVLFLQNLKTIVFLKPYKGPNLINFYRPISLLKYIYTCILYILLNFTKIIQSPTWESTSPVHGRFIKKRNLPKQNKEKKWKKGKQGKFDIEQNKARDQGYALQRKEQLHTKILDISVWLWPMP